MIQLVRKLSLLSVFCLPLLLKAQSVSTFTGTVFRDSNGDGIQDPGEEGIPGVLVELRGGATASTLNAAVLTDADGHYTVSDTDLPDASNYQLRYYYPREAFSITTTGFSTSGNIISGYTRSSNFTIAGGTPLDEEVSLGLEPVYETLSFSAVKGLAGTNWGPEHLTLPKSPAGYGVLKEVKLYINYHVVNPSAVITNNDGTNPGSGNFQTGATFTVGTPFDEDVLGPSTFSYQHPLVMLAPGESISQSNLHHAQGAIWHEYDEAYFSSFEGSDTFNVPFESTGSSAIIVNSGNVTGTISTLSAPGVFVVYIYEEGSLPVNLVNFDAVPEGGSVTLQWSTANESNSLSFEVERSNNARIWTKIGTVAASGESESLRTYHFPDQNALKGTSYYRLKMIDRDGSFDYSPLVSVANRFGTGAVQAFSYPNPASEVIFLENLESSRLDGVSIISSTGKSVKVGLTYDNHNGIDVRDLPEGIYFLKYHYEGELKTIKFLVKK